MKGIGPQALSYRAQTAADFRLVERLTRTLDPFVDALLSLLMQPRGIEMVFGA